MKVGEFIQIPTGNLAGQTGEIIEIGSERVKMRVGKLIVEAQRKMLEAVEGIEESVEGKEKRLPKSRERESRERKPENTGTKKRREIFNSSLAVKENKGGINTMAKQEKNQGTNQGTTGQFTTTPFGSALYFARQVTTPRPEEQQPEVYADIKKAVDQLDELGRRNLVFRLQKEVMEGKAQLGALFAVARMSRMLAVAAATATVRKTGLTFDGLQEAGLVTIDPAKDNKPARTRYNFGHQKLAEAAKILRHKGNLIAAQTIENHVSAGERARALRQAVQNTATT